MTGVPLPLQTADPHHIGTPSVAPDTPIPVQRLSLFHARNAPSLILARQLHAEYRPQRGHETTNLPHACHPLDLVPREEKVDQARLAIRALPRACLRLPLVGPRGKLLRIGRPKNCTPLFTNRKKTARLEGCNGGHQACASCPVRPLSLLHLAKCINVIRFKENMEQKSKSSMSSATMSNDELAVFETPTSMAVFGDEWKGKQTLRDEQLLVFETLTTTAVFGEEWKGNQTRRGM